MKLTATTITDEQIRELQDSANRCTEMACSTCHEIWRATRIVLDKDNHDGDLISPEGIAARIRAARARCAEIINARARTRCPGRQHDHHIGDVCDGECCSACGGPIDENEECRC